MRSTWNDSPLMYAILAERERQVARLRLDQKARKDRQSEGIGSSGSQQSSPLPSVRHRLAVMCHLA